MSTRNHQTTEEDDRTPPGENYKWRPGRGWVHQMGGGSTRVDPQDIANNRPAGLSDPVDWRATFKSSQVPIPQPATPGPTPATAHDDTGTAPVAGPTPTKPMTADQRFASNFPVYGQGGTARGIAPPAPPAPRLAAPAGTVNPLAGLAPERSVTPGATASHLTGNLVVPGHGTIRAPHASAPQPGWDKAITDLYPSIGVAGSTENKAFLDAFHQHGAWERGMDTAHQIMGATPGATARNTETQRLRRGPTLGATTPPKRGPINPLA